MYEMMYDYPDLRGVRILISDRPAKMQRLKEYEDLRTKWTDMIALCGGEVVASLDEDPKYMLLTQMGALQRIIKDAKKRGIPVLSEQEAADLLGSAYDFRVFNAPSGRSLIGLRRLPENFIVPNGITEINIRGCPGEEPDRSAPVRWTVPVRWAAHYGVVSLPATLERVISWGGDRCTCDTLDLMRFTGKLPSHVYLPETVRIRVADPVYLAPRYRMLAAIGFADDEADLTEARRAAHMKYIRDRVEKLCKCAMDHIALLKLMCDNGVIRVQDYDAYVKAAEEAENTHALAMLLEYRRTKLTDEKFEAHARKLEQLQDRVFERALSRTAGNGIRGMRFSALGELKYYEGQKELAEYLAGFGASLSPMVTARTDCLITNDPDSNSNKIRRARELGIEIIDEYTLFRMIGPEGVFDIRDGVVNGCRCTDEDIVLPEGIVGIGKGVFMKRKLRSIRLPQGLKTIGESAFEECCIDRIELPDTVTEVGKSAFCVAGIKELVIPGGLKRVEDMAFYSHLIEHLTISGDVGDIDIHAFGWGDDINDEGSPMFRGKLTVVGKVSKSLRAVLRRSRAESVGFVSGKN